MIIHLMLNSLFVFLILMLLIELSLWSLGIKNSRVRYLCRALAFMKIPFDLLTFLFFEHSPLVNLNPLSCEVYVYQLGAQLFPLYFESTPVDSSPLIIPHYLASQLPIHWLYGLNGFVITVALTGVVFKLYQLKIAHQYLQTVLGTAKPYLKHILNPLLEQDLEKKQARIGISSRIQIPCAIGSKYIILPQQNLESLSVQELEAVIAHELQHLHWRDPFLKWGCTIISTFCWWIPTNGWMKRIIMAQEEACDAGIHRYKINPYDLAHALYKILHTAPVEPKLSLVCLLASSSQRHLSRIKHILNNQALVLNYEYQFKDIIAGVFCLSIFFCFWMC